MRSRDAWNRSGTNGRVEPLSFDLAQHARCDEPAQVAEPLRREYLEVNAGRSRPS